VDLSTLNITSLKKVAMLFRDHRLDQIRNTLRFGYHAFHGFPTAQVPYDPLWLILFITTRCNLRCRFCQIWGLDTRRKQPSFQEMKLNTFREILARFPKTIAVDFTGGEPLLNPHLFEMACLAHERRIKVHLITNATLLQDKLDAFLETPFEFVNISLNGPDAETFAKVTGNSMSMFDDMVKAVAELCRRRRPGGFPRTIRASFICSKDNWELVPDVIRLCEKLGVDMVKLKNLHIHDMPGLDGRCLYEDDQDARNFVAGLRRRQFRVPVFVPRLYRRNYNPRRCNMPFRTLPIDGDGAIAPCCVSGTAKRWGNALEEPGIWNGPALVDMRRVLLDPTCPLPNICLDCEEMLPERPQCGHVAEMTTA
jgi:MoaA/NifB/PqqE/SkfB family radical SAM enzyme